MNAPTVPTVPTVPANWLRAMRRAQEERLRSFKLAGGSGYLVQSTSVDPGAFHVVSVDSRGKITGCSDCPGWNRPTGSNDRTVCKHAGCVANRLIRERYGWRMLGAILNPEIPADAAEPVEEVA